MSGRALPRSLKLSSLYKEFAFSSNAIYKRCAVRQLLSERERIADQLERFHKDSMDKFRIVHLNPRLLLAIFILMAQPFSAQPSLLPDEAALQEQTRIFFKAYEKRDSAVLLKWWDQQSPSLNNSQSQVTKLFSTVEKLELLNLKFYPAEMDGQSVRLRVEAEFLALDIQTRQTRAEMQSHKRVLYWGKQGNEWKIKQEISAYEDLANRLLASDEANQQQLLIKHADLVTVELSRAVNALGLDRYLARPADAVFINRAFHLAATLARQLNDAASLAEPLNNLCLAMHDQRKDEEALAYCHQAQPLFSAIDDKLGLARVFERLGMVNASRGEHATAKSNFEESLKIRYELGDDDRTARTLNQYGLWHYELGYYEQAAEIFQRAIKLREQLEQSNRDSRANQNSKRLLLANLGIIYEHQSELALALATYEKSLAIAQNLKLETGLLALEIGSIYKKQGNYDLALRYFSESLAVYERQGLLPQIIGVLGKFGDTYQLMGNREKSIESYGKALELSERANHKRYICQTLVWLGADLASQQLYDRASPYLEKAVTACDPSFNRDHVASVYLQLATIHLAKNDRLRASSLADQACALLALTESVEMRSRALATAGNIYLATNQFEKARKALLESIQLIEQMRIKAVGEQEQRQALFENKTAPYLAFTEILLAENQPEAAFTQAERAKARALLDTMQSGKANPAKALTTAEFEQERKLNRELIALNQQLHREQTSEITNTQRLADLKPQLEKARLDYEDFRTRLYAAHPELRVQRGEAKPITLAEAGELLPDARTALVHYVVMPEHVRAFVITRGRDRQPQLRVETLPLKRDELAQRVENLRGLLARGEARFHTLATELYAQLFKPLRAHLPAQARLVIVPDGPLWELPFQALLNERNRYLWEDHTLVYAPSLTVLREMMRARKTKAPVAQPALLAMGDPQLGGAAVERTQQLMGGALEQLPEARLQVERLQQFYDPQRRKVFTGAAATEAQWKAEAEKADVLHLAAHGVLNDRNPLYSHIVLAQSADAQQTQQDGLLEAWELMDMNLRADLAVLSACETARGRVGAGEGMIGLTWALFVAGVPSSVVSQWKVRADSTAELMVEFHRQLRASKPVATEWTKAEALRQAALKLLRNSQYRHPFHWAGFVLVGKPQ